MGIFESKFRPKTQLLLSCMLLLSGCGAEQLGAPSTEGPSVGDGNGDIFYVGDGIAKAITGKESHINVSEFVQGNNVKITDIQSLGNESECGVPKLNDTGFKITASKNGVCEYQYEAQKEGNKATGKITVLVSLEFTDIEPVTGPPVIRGTTTEYNLKSLLGTDDVSDETKIVSLVVSGTYPSIGTATPILPHNLSFTAPDLAGWNKVQYVLEDPDGTIKNGNIYITISDGGNYPPTIGMPEYSYNYKVEDYDLVIRPSSLGCQNSNCDLTASLNDKSHVKMGLYNTDYADSITLPSGSTFDKKKVTIISSVEYPTKVYADNDNDGVEEELLAICFESSCKDEEAVFINIDNKWQKSMMPSYLLPGDKVSFELNNIPELQIVEPNDDYWGLSFAEGGPGVKIREFSTGFQFERTLTVDIVSPGLYNIFYVIEDDKHAGNAGVIEIIVDSPKVYPCLGESYYYDCLPITPNFPTRYLYTPAVTPGILQSKGIEPDLTIRGGNGDPDFMEIGLLTYDNTVKWCQALADEFYAGRSDWRVPSVSNLQELYKSQGMDGYASWPTSRSYWSKDTSGENTQMSVNMGKDFSTVPIHIDEPQFPVCISRQ